MEKLIPVKLCSRYKPSQMFALLWKPLTSKDYTECGAAYFSSAVIALQNFFQS